MDGEIPLKSTFVALTAHCSKQTCICIPHDMALHFMPAPALSLPYKRQMGTSSPLLLREPRLRAPGASDYYVSKHALNRLEFVGLGELGH